LRGKFSIFGWLAGAGGCSLAALALAGGWRGVSKSNFSEITVDAML
jgi:hypothetical protein